VIEPPNAVAYRCDNLGMRMAEHRAHLARGEVQYAPASIIVEKGSLGPNRHEIDELAAIFEQVTPSACPKLRIGRNGTLVHCRSPFAETRLRCRSAAQLSPNRCQQLTDREMRYSAAAAWVRVNSLTASTSV